MDKEWPDYEKEPQAEEFRKMFVGGLELKTTEETLRQFFASYGEIDEILLMKDKMSNPPKSKGFAFITFKSSDSLDEVQKNRPHTIDGKKIETKRATPKQQQYWSTKKLYVKEFNKDVDEEELVAEMKDVFGKFGTVKDVHLVKEKGDAGLKGYGFIEFDDEDPVDKCNLLRKFMVKDKQVKVAKAYNQEKGRGKGGRAPEYYNGYDDYYYGYYYPPFPYMGGRGGGGGGGEYRNYGGYDYNYRRGGRGYSRGGGGRAYRGGY